MTARALVIRSGGKSFRSVSEPLSVEIVEKVSHTIVPLALGVEELDKPADWAVFTSQVAVRRLQEEPEFLNRFRQAVATGCVAAVGAATAAALERAGFPPQAVASGSAENVLQKLPASLEGKRVLLPRGEDASEELRAGLTQRGARVAPVVLYRKRPRPRDPDLDREIAQRPFKVFCATSPAAARWLFAGIADGPLERLRGTPAVVLGRFTARFLASHGIARIEIAPEATFAAAARLLVALADESALDRSSLNQ